MAQSAAFHGATCEDHAILGTMTEFNAFGRAGENHRMLADHRAAAQRRKTDIASLTRTGVSIARAHRPLIETDATTIGGGAAKQQRGAGRRIDFLVVMHFKDFNIEILIQRFCHALHQRRQQIDAEAHVAGLDDYRTLGGFRDRRFIVSRKPRGADNVDDAGLGRELRVIRPSQPVS